MFRSIMSTEELELLDGITPAEGTVEQGTNTDDTTGTIDTRRTTEDNSGAEGTIDTTVTVPLDTDPTSEIGVEVEQNINDSTDFISTIEAESEGFETSDVLQEIEEAETPEEKLEIAIEALLKNVGLKTNKISLEDYDNKLNKNLQISQEGFFGRIGNSFKRAFTSRTKLSDKLQQALDKLEKNGTREGDIKDPSWSKSLITNNTRRVTSAEVVAYYNKLYTVITSKDIDDFFKEAATVIQKVATELDKGRFFADDEGTKNILSLNTEIDQITNKLDAYLNSKSSNSIDKYPDYEPISIKDAKTLVSKLEEKIANAYGPGEKNYMDVIAKYNDNFFNNIVLRIAGNNASDVKAARKVVTSINRSSSKIFRLVALLNKATYSVVRYIEDSSK